LLVARQDAVMHKTDQDIKTLRFEGGGQPNGTETDNDTGRQPQGNGISARRRDVITCGTRVRRED
jgi:hypothetical protein